MPRKEQIRNMFDGIAPSYDSLNHLMSLGVDKGWRRQAVKAVVDGSAQKILDVACGTGDLTVALAAASAKGSTIVGTDISEGMMALVGQKAAKEGVISKISLKTADGEALPFADGEFDAVTCAFGIRNFEHKEKGLQEFLRVLRPGGKLAILELSVPDRRFVRGLYDIYFMHVLPLIGGAVSGEKSAYRYLPASVHSFPSPGEFGGMIRSAGFSGVEVKSLSMGLCRLYTAVR